MLIFVISNRSTDLMVENYIQVVTEHCCSLADREEGGGFTYPYVSFCPH